MKFRKKPRQGGTWNLVVLGLISCFSDISSEMVYPLIPLYLTAAFGATPAMIGIVEGFAESVAGLLKVFSGYLSDRFQQKKALAFGGYAAGVLYKIALLFSGSWTGILGARVIDRFGKGVRTAPRDVMVAESAGESGMGQAFGIHKMLDMAGSAIGILLAFILVRRVGSDGYRTVFAVSIIPISFSLLLFFLIHEKKGRHEVAPRERFWRNISRLDGRFKLYLTVTFLFTLGNSSNSFLLLRASDIGFDDSDMILLYFLYNVIASALAIPCGKLSDKIGRKRVLVWGYLTFSLVYFGFALCNTKLMMALIFVIYGGYRRSGASLHCGGRTAAVERYNARPALDARRNCSAAGQRHRRAALGWHRRGGAFYIWWGSFSVVRRHTGVEIGGCSRYAERLDIGLRSFCSQ